MSILSVKNIISTILYFTLYSHSSQPLNILPLSAVEGTNSPFLPSLPSLSSRASLPCLLHSMNAHQACGNHRNSRLFAIFLRLFFANTVTYAPQTPSK